MRAGLGYMPEDSIYPFSGLNTLDPSPQADHRSSPRCQNVLFTKGIAAKRGGYTYLGASFDSDTNPVQLVVEFEDIDGIKSLLAFTTRRQYRYDAIDEIWVDITTTSEGEAVEWTGDETDVLDYALVTGLYEADDVLVRRIIVTNGKDKPRFWGGDTGTMVDWEPTGIANFKTCKTLKSYADHLFVGNIVFTTGDDQRTTFFWADFQSLDDFTSGDGFTSGEGVLTDVDGEIQKFTILGDRLYIYGQNTIHSISYVGGTVLFVAEKILSNIRLVSPRCIAEIGPYHLFLSQENIVYFDGSRLTREIGDKIYRSYREELSAGSRHFAFAFHDNAKREVYFNYPTSTGDSAIYHVEYSNQDILAGRWTRLDYYDRICSMGFFSRDIDLRCDSTQLSGVACSSVTITCAQGSIKGGFPVRVMGTATGRVCLADDTTQNDVNQVVDAFVDTVDFPVPQVYQSELGRWIELEVELAGFEVDVYYSIDQGTTFTFLEKLNLESRFKKYKVFFDLMSQNLRIRLRNNCPSSTFQLRWLRLWVQRGGAA